MLCRPVPPRTRVILAAGGSVLSLLAHLFSCTVFRCFCRVQTQVMSCWEPPHSLNFPRSFSRAASAACLLTIFIIFIKLSANQTYLIWYLDYFEILSDCVFISSSLHLSDPYRHGFLFLYQGMRGPSPSGSSHCPLLSLHSSVTPGLSHKKGP